MINFQHTQRYAEELAKLDHFLPHEQACFLDGVGDHRVLFVALVHLGGYSVAVGLPPRWAHD